jgi:hypothetical protein
MRQIRVLYFSTLIFLFIGCGKYSFDLGTSAKLGSLATLSTPEDTPAQFQLKTNSQSKRFQIEGYKNGKLKTDLATITELDEEKGTFRYTPDPDAFGNERVAVSVTFENEAPAYFFQPMTITPVNDPPQAKNLDIQVTLNQAHTISFHDFQISDIDSPDVNLFIRNMEGLRSTVGIETFRSQLKYLGKVEDKNNFSFKATALGSQTLNFIVFDGENSLNVKATFHTQVPLKDFKPALAVRDTSCIFCHASVKGNVVTDFGYNSDQLVEMYSNNQEKFESGGYLLGGWGHGGANSLSTSFIEGEIFVPRRDLAEDAAAYTSEKIRVGKSETMETLILVPIRDSDNEIIGWEPRPGATADPIFLLANPYSDVNLLNSLADYFDALLSYRTPEYLDYMAGPYGRPKSPDIDPNNFSIREVNRVIIGTPSRDEILAAFFPDGYDNSSIKYIKQDDLGFDLQGLEVNEGWIQNSPDQPLECDGDLFIGSLLFLRNLKLKSQFGCRIYALSNVFIEAPGEHSDDLEGIKYLSDEGYIEITTPKAIVMGVGLESNGYDRMVQRSEHHRTDLTPDLIELGAFDDYQFLKAQLPADQLLDASNSINGRGVNFRRLLLNANTIHTRYKGDFEGVIIAEFVLGSLGAFAYRYDERFNQLPFLPLLRSETIFKVEESCAQYDPDSGDRISDTSVAVRGNIRSCLE